MGLATDKQVQEFSDQRLRVRAEQFRALVNGCRDDKAAINDVYAACILPVPTWTDNRSDGPPRLCTVQDVLTYNAFITLFLKCVDGTATLADIGQLNANWAPFQSACVRAL